MVCLVSIFTMSSCRFINSQPPATQSQVSAGAAGGNKGPLVVRKTRAVMYKLMKANPTTMGKESTVSFANGNLSITVRPKDFDGSAVSCERGVCEALLVEPLVVNATVPTGLHAKVKVRYKQSRTTAEKAFSHHVTVGGQWTVFEAGPILSLSIEAGLTLSALPDNHYVPRITDVVCTKSLTCETPLFIVSGSVDRHGLQFDSRLVVSQQNGTFEKVVADVGRAKKEITFGNLDIKAWGQLLAEKLPIKPEGYDTEWDLDPKGPSCDKCNCRPKKTDTEGDR